jgi:hypothetical protein
MDGEVSGWVKWSITLALAVGGIVAALVGFLIRGERRMTAIEVGAASEKERSRERGAALEGFISDVRTEVRQTREELRQDIHALSTKIDACLPHRTEKPL